MINEIYIGNILESYWKSHELLLENEKNYWMKYDSMDNNRSLLYGADDKVLITPQKINMLQMDYVSSLCGWKNVLNLCPEVKSGSVCQDIFRDKKMWRTLIDIVKSNPKVKIIPYRQTEDFYELISLLHKENLIFTLPETPDEENRFIESYFHNKRGFRHLWEVVKDKSNKINIPIGFITADKNEAIEAAYWLKLHQKNVVIKYNRGVQGLGVTFIDSLAMPNDKKSFVENIEKLLSENIWQEPIIVVEEKIDINPEILGGSPNVEMRIDHDGKVIREYACQQLIADDKKTFLGVSINREVNNHPLIEEAYKAAELFGKELSTLGYRGFFDMDLVVSKTGDIYAIESNLRRTGGTHVHLFAQSLLGKKYWLDHCLISKDIKVPKTKKYSTTSIYAKLKPILYNLETKCGVVIINVDMLEVEILPVMVIGNDIKHAVELLKHVENLL